MPSHLRSALSALGLSLFLALCGTSASAQQLPAHVQLPAPPSVLLTAPLSVWRPLLARLDEWLALQAEKVEKPEVQMQLLVQRTLVAQARGDWGGALTSLRAARLRQTSLVGRHTSGLLNELLALQAQGQHDAAWLRNETRAAVLAMPWQDVESSIRGFRQALVTMESDGVHRYVAGKMDVASGLTKGNVDPGFALQLLGLRFQLEQLLPQRPALILGLDEAIREREVNR